jgi:hypothetical protein
VTTIPCLPESNRSVIIDDLITRYIAGEIDCRTLKEW